MAEEQKLYASRSQGLSAFLIFVLSEDCFSHITLDERQRPVVWFHDVTEGNSCAELAKMYEEGAMLRNAREYSECWEFVGHKIRQAFKHHHEKQVKQSRC